MTLIAILALSVLAAIAGGAAPLVDRVAARAGLRRVQAFRSGILIAVAFGDILPEAWRLAPAYAGWGALAAFAFCRAAEHIAPLDPCREASEDCRSHPLEKAAIAGLFLHSFFDGVNLGAAAHAGTAVLIAVGAATILHKLADGFTITTMLRGGSDGLKNAALAVVALATPLGAASSSLVVRQLDPWAFSLLLAFAGGSFLYIGASEVLPHLHRREQGGPSSLASFGAGLAAMLLMRRLM
ncbi:MAG: ZIP family metal transporter [Elusimicrobia bacterium]|nr:ZIP family metal transporter [Elusimicrobiota bacterium]